MFISIIKFFIFKIIVCCIITESLFSQGYDPYGQQPYQDPYGQQPYQDPYGQDPNQQEPNPNEPSEAEIEAAEAAAAEAAKKAKELAKKGKLFGKYELGFAGGMMFPFFDQAIKEKFTYGFGGDMVFRLRFKWPQSAPKFIVSLRYEQFKKNQYTLERTMISGGLEWVLWMGNYFAFKFNFIPGLAYELNSLESSLASTRLTTISFNFNAYSDWGVEIKLVRSTAIYLVARANYRYASKSQFFEVAPIFGIIFTFF